jgi:hypothetical protein
MRTVDVPAQDWSRTLDEFSANHEGAPVSLELLAPALGAQLEVRDLPLLGITVETGARDPTLLPSAVARPRGWRALSQAFSALFASSAVCYQARTRPVSTCTKFEAG